MMMKIFAPAALLASLALAACGSEPAANAPAAKTEVAEIDPSLPPEDAWAKCLELEAGEVSDSDTPEVATDKIMANCASFEVEMRKAVAARAGDQSAAAISGEVDTIMETARESIVQVITDARAAG